MEDATWPKDEGSFCATGAATRKGGSGAVRYNDRVPKRQCTHRAEWRLPPGKPAEHLSPYYQLGCDYGTALMEIYKEGDAIEPLYLCESHAAEMGPSRDDSTATRLGVRLIADPAIVDRASVDSGEKRTSDPAKQSKNAKNERPKTARWENKQAGSGKAKVPARKEPAGGRADREEHEKSAREEARVESGQLEDVKHKISECTQEIEALLSESTAKINVGDVIDKPLEQATLEIIGSRALGDSEKDVAIARLGALQEWIHRGLEREITPLQASRIARDVRDRIEGRDRANAGTGAAILGELKPAYRTVYASLRNAVCAAVPGARKLDDCLAELEATRCALEKGIEAKELHSQTA